MLYLAILFLFMSTLPILVSSLHCYSCKQIIIVNYPVTSDTVPSFSDCQLVNGTQCSIIVSWDQNINITAIVVDTRNAPSTNDPLEDFIEPMAFMEIIHESETPLLAHALLFSCMSSDKCNDEMGLKRILRSLIIEDKFVQELSSLLKVVSPFDPESAACFEFNNSTSDCPPKDLDTCQRCQITVDKLLSSSQEVCATCPRDSINRNTVIHSTTFLLNNRTQLPDHVQLDCQLKGCNSIKNVDRIFNASKITFDFGEFFKNSLEDVINRSYLS